MLKSEAVSSPAGSGKTERLATRYLDLLRQMPVPRRPERILAITFTDKAAAEMKDRIFRKAKEKYPELVPLLKDKILKLRISTIHSFCLSLIRRFAPDLELEPDLEALSTADDLWQATVYDTMMAIAERGGLDPDFRLLLELVTSERMKGWDKLTSRLQALFAQRSQAERATLVPVDLPRLAELAALLRESVVGKDQISGYRSLFPKKLDLPAILQVRAGLEPARSEFMTQQRTPYKRGKPDFLTWSIAMTEYWTLVEKVHHQEAFRQQLELFRSRFLREYDRRKLDLSQIDFSDMERLAHDLLVRNEQWSNILLAFDEHTDHILVDEFQDTSYLQWGIVNKLTEDWQAGAGRKFEQGVQPTIFIVGDDKQSIYRFRGAHAEIFRTVEQKLAQWLGPERFESLEEERNFRSLSSIIDFTNHVFSRLMERPDSERPAWYTRYGPFRLCRENPDPGRVEFLLESAPESSVGERREIEAELVAQRIKSLIGLPIVYQDEQPQECRFEHITILLRDRNYLDRYEAALTRHGIPYLVQKGIGFFKEREIQFMNSLLSVLIDPFDDFSLYVLLRSPFFGLSEHDLFLISTQPGTTYFEKLGLYVRTGGKVGPATAIEQILNWVGNVNHRPVAGIVDEILARQQVWTRFWEPQRAANVRKFLQIVDDFESRGMPPLRIRETLNRMAERRKEAKASLDARELNVVQIMTLHNAKGLQFPIVFLPLLDMKLKTDLPELILDERLSGEVTASSLPDSHLRNQDPLFIEYRRKQEEEAKRHLYVGVTRARDALFLSGVTRDAPPKELSWLKWLWDILGLNYAQGNFTMQTELNGVRLVSRAGVEASARDAASRLPEPEPQPVKPLLIEPVEKRPAWRIVPVTRDTPSDRKRHGDDAISFGVVMHQALERIAKSELDPNDGDAVMSLVGRLFVFEGVADELAPKLCEQVIGQLDRLRRNGLLDLALPQPNSYAELPFLLRPSLTPDPRSPAPIIYSGRIDRLIVREETVDVYDYKTFPVKESELEQLAAEYRDRQMRLYLEAARALFPAKKPRAFLIFTALPRLVPLIVS